jgi:hypothetical protein
MTVTLQEILASNPEMDMSQAMDQVRTGGSGLATLPDVSPMQGGPKVEKTDPFPALETEPFAYTTVPVMKREFGEPMGMLPFYDPKIAATPIMKNPAKVTPNIFIQDLPGFDFSSAEAKEDFKNAQGIYYLENGQTRYLPFSGLPDNYQERMNAANKVAATSIGLMDKNGQLQRFPWDEYLMQETTIPNVELMLMDREAALDESGDPNYRRVNIADLSEDELESYINNNLIVSLNNLDKEIADPLYGHIIKKRLKALGVDDPRTVLSIVKFATSSRDRGDFEKIANTAVETNVKMPMQFVLFGIGEALDVMDEVSRIAAGDDDEESYYDIRSSARRQTIMDNAWLPAAEMFIGKMKQRGVDVPLYAAEEYMNIFTGWAPRVVNVAGTVLPLSRVLAARSAFNNEKEYRMFEKFLETEVARGKSRSIEDSLKLFVELRPNLTRVTKERQEKARQILKSGTGTTLQKSEAKLMADAKVGDVISVGKPPPPTLLNRLRRSIVQTRVLRGIEQMDAAQAAPIRTEVVRQQKVIDRLDTRRKGLEVRIERGDATADDYAKLSVIADDIDRATEQLRAVQLSSRTPRWMRDLVSTDNALILGAGTFGHMFQMTEPDPDSPLTSSTYMGELIGIGAGILYKGMAAAKNPAAFRLARTGLGSTFLKRTMGKKQYADWLAANISKYSPDFQSAFMARGEYLDEAFDPLIAAGLPEETIVMSVASITQLVAHQTLEDAVRLTIGSGDIASDPLKVQTLQQLATSKQVLVEELRSVLFGLKSPEESALMDANSTAYNEFYKLVNSAVEQGQLQVDELTKALDTLGKDGLQVQKDKLTGGMSMYAGNTASASTQLSIQESLDLLHKKNLITNAGLPTYEYKMLAEAVSTEVVKAVKKASDSITSELGDVEKARIKLKDFRDIKNPFGILAQGAKQKALISAARDESELLAILMEAAHSNQKSVAQQPYQRFGTDEQPAQFFLQDETPVGAGMAFVETGDLFDLLFTLEEAGVIASRQLGQEGMTRGNKARLELTWKELSEPFFSSLAEPGEDVNDVVKNIKAALKEDGYRFNKVDDDHIQVIRHMRTIAMNEEAPDATMVSSMFRMSFNQLREFDRAIRSLRNSVDTGEDATRLRVVSRAIDEKFGNFSVMTDDGQVLPGQTLFLKNKAGQLESTSDVLKAANAGWLDYRSRWYDKGSTIPKWMSWGNRNKSPDGLVNDVVGITYGNDPLNWLDMDKILKASPAQQAKIFKDVVKVIGTKVDATDPRLPPTPGGVALQQFEFVEGDVTTDAFVGILRAGLSRHLVQQGAELKAGEAVKQMQMLANTFVMRGKDGEMVPMINAGKVFDEMTANSPNTIREDVFVAELGKAMDELETSVENFLDPAAQHLAAKKIAVGFIQRFSSENLADTDIAKAIISGGSSLIGKVRSELKLNAKMSEDQIDAVLAHVYLDSIMEAAFTTKTETIMAVGKNGRVTPTPIVRRDTNIGAITELLGLDNPTRAAVVKELIGDRRYAVWMSAAKVMSEIEGPSPGGVARAGLTGIPRAMSLEGHAARLFAWQRHAIGLKWYATENAIQAARLKNYNILIGALTDPELGEYFMEMLRTGAPLSREKDTLFKRSLVNSSAFFTAQSQLLMKEKEVKDSYGVPVTVNPGGRGPDEMLNRVKPQLSDNMFDMLKSMMPFAGEGGKMLPPEETINRRVQGGIQDLFGPPR